MEHGRVVSASTLTSAQGTRSFSHSLPGSPAPVRLSVSPPLPPSVFLVPLFPLSHPPPLHQEHSSGRNGSVRDMYY